MGDLKENIVKENYFKKDNTFFTVAKYNPKDLIEKEIGDSKEPTKFLPQQKITRWDNEVNVSVRLVHDEKAPVITKKGDIIKWSGDKIDAKFYDINSEEHPEGASEFEIVLKEKPKTNVVKFTLVDKGVEYFYQPFLKNQREDGTYWEERDGGIIESPENVVGSYAVYASENKVNYVGGKEYKCGKVGHIYRPQIEDSAGNKVWGELKIKNGILSVTIPQEFLDKAVYPVKHAAGLTFGYTSIGATKFSNYDGIDGCKFTSPSDASAVTSTTTYVGYVAGTGKLFGTALYNSSLSKVASNSGSVIVPTGNNWLTNNLSSSISASTDYWLCAWNSYVVHYYADTGSANQNFYKQGYTWESWPSSISSPSYYAYILSIYATYTAGGGEPTAKSVSDTGSGADVIDRPYVALTPADSGQGSDTSLLTILLTISEAGLGAESISLLNQFLIADTASGNDSILLTAIMALQETGSGTDLVALLNNLAISDTFEGEDGITLLNSINTAESATGSESEAILGIITTQEAGEGSESQEIFNTLGVLTDLASGNEDLNKAEEGDDKTVNENGTGNDLLTLLNTFAITDLGEAVDILNILNQLSISDIGSVNDLVNILGLIEKTDTASATESFNILNTLNISETATGSDVVDLLLLLKELTVSEIGLGSDDVAIIASALIELTENATGQDLLYILNLISKSEAGHGIENLNILAELNITDSAVGNEFIEMLNEVSIDVFDNAEAVDIIAKYLVKIYTKRNNPYRGKSSPYSKKV